MTKAGFTTKHQAQVALEEAVARERAGVAEVHALTVEEYLSQWLASKKSIRDTTRRGYETDIRKYLAPGQGASGWLTFVRITWTSCTPR